MMRPIAYIHTDYREKFGIPRQSGLVDSALGEIVFEPEYRRDEALRGIEAFSHIWLIWEFSRAVRQEWSPTVRPPRLGGNTRMGVFATRSPFRPNPIGLSCVRLVGLHRNKKNGTTLIVAGTDLLDGTPIYDIKPYLPYTDAHPEATGGFTDGTQFREMNVQCADSLLAGLPAEKRQALRDVLRQNPRPSYQRDEDRRYGMAFADWNIQFHYQGDTIVVDDVQKSS